ncbi:galactose mutarotase [Kaistia dalseonensis]|uniref:Aldose 1-epimerase n=1 Tax=Kaistia dalseonensis TaxID=410840 RepID=A0ABU0H9B8_9HYPH|nr:aldose epimerase family protein [Kaistia dalseonensis]MCX5496305.1 galactose mutarotase [Kaistia dalseonensis]MDQ0438923.1 aldose 1-epimerase [Kaistia dalseonensis]
MTTRSFGTLPDGTTIDAITIANDTLSARIITYGAVIQDIRLAGIDHPLVLGFDTIDAYLRNPNYFGAVAGRFANRIADGRFSIDGESFQLAQNEGPNHLHGGFDGFGTRVWSILGSDETSVTLGIVGADGENGYPGRVSVELTYSIEAPATLRTSIRATTDKATIVNLAQHSYFNLDGAGTIRDHVLTIPAETYLPIDAGKIPTGEFRPVAGTPFDFRAGRKVDTGDVIIDTYDHNFVVTHAKTEAPHLVARLVSEKSGIAMDVLSTEPGVQFYGGQMITSRDLGLNGEVYGANSGLCLEAQLFPDAPNQPGFPSAVLRPGETYHQETLFAFSRV